MPDRLSNLIIEYRLIRYILTVILISKLGCFIDNLNAQGNDQGVKTVILANEISYNRETNTITAIGNVEVEREERILLADKISFNEKNDLVTAIGNVTLLDKTGSVMFFDKVNISGDLKKGFARNVKVLLADKSKMAARKVRRNENNVNELRQAVFTACDVECDKNPLWQIKANKVIHYQNEQLMTYNDAWIEMYGIPVFYTPYLAHPDPTAKRKSGFLTPSIGGGDNLGFLFAIPYYLDIGSNKDATFTPLYTSLAGKGLTTEYRQLFNKGKIEFFGSLVSGDNDNTKDLRGHIKAATRWDLNKKWRTGADFHLASDDTYLRRYNLDAPTWLTTNAFVERFGTQSYFSINAYHFQSQRRIIALGSTPIITPLIEYKYFGKPSKFGSFITANASALALYRENGSDQTRLSSEIVWNLPYVSPYGGLYSLKASLRGDGYYVRDVLNPETNSSFTGNKERFFPQLSMEWRLPLLKESKNSSNYIEPIIQGIISPAAKNPFEIPNEDSRDLEFDDTNLFVEQRFSGKDRVEGGARINYGVLWNLQTQSNSFIEVLVGQSYRFKKQNIFSNGSGLNGKFSDYVGHIRYNPTKYFDLSYRFRINNSNFSAEKSEISAAFGNKLIRIGSNYTKVKQSDTQNKELEDREELYAYFNARLSKYWNLTGSHRQNLGPKGGPIRSSIGFSYEDECFIAGLDFAEDNTEDRDFDRGFSVMLRFTLKTLGEIKLSSNVGVGQ